MRLVAYDGTGAVIWPRWILARIGRCVNTAANATDLLAREDREWAERRAELAPPAPDPDRDWSVLEVRRPVTPAEIGIAEAMEGDDDD